MSDTKEIFGRTITGEVVRHGDKQAVEQWPNEKFIEMLDDIFADPQVDSVRWRQYTPYFNDGDPCEFGIAEVLVKLVAADEDDGDYEDGYISTYEMRADGIADWRTENVKPEFTQVARALRALGGSMRSFEDFLKGTFGDHAVVTAHRDGFAIEYFDHD